MGKKANKASRKYAASGQLKKEIQTRRKHQQVKRSIERRKGGKPRGKDAASASDRERVGEKRKVRDEEEDEGEDMSDAETGKLKGMSVDDFLRGGFMGDDSDIEAEEEGSEASEDGDEDGDDNASFASIDDIEDDEAVTHKVELEKLAEQDPEFYKYLQENDRELLDFDVDEDVDEDKNIDEDVMDVDNGGEDEKAPTLTKDVLRRWQKAILEHRSLRALRRLLMAFRAATHMNEEGEVLAWTIDSSSVYEKLVTTALRYTPIVLHHHVPYKKLRNGSKPPAQTPKLSSVQKIILSFFHNVMHLIDQLSASETLVLAVNESAKLLPYVVSSRKAIKLYLKTCLKLWSSAEDDVRIAAFLAIRRLTWSGEESIRDMALKNTYLTLLRNAKSTTAHTLPSINLMKNSASELFCEDHAAAYQHAFAYIRQLAVHLRNSIKVKSKDAFKQVYNWQYAHSVDFWSIVLARACDRQAESLRGEESELKALIYPLVQVALGAVKLITSSRSWPFHLCLIRSLIHLSRHTATYIPLTPYFLPIITATLSPSGRPKASTLKPLDLETHLRAPAQYVRTRIYNSTVLEESVFLLAEWASTPHVQGSIAFPELVVPLVATLKRSLKRAAGGKEASVVKGFLERAEEGAMWVSDRRKDVTFGPKNVDAVHAWEKNLSVEEMPLSKYLKSQRKMREKRKKLVDKARAGEEEYLEE